MSDVVSFIELDGQHVELLPARTVLSVFVQGTDGGQASNGHDGTGSIGLGVPILDKMFPPASSNGVGTNGGSANGT